jgi:hypothetical protein
MLVKANTFHLNWSDVNKGGFVILTPTSSSNPAAATINSISGDTVTISDNLSQWKPGFMVYISSSSSPQHNGLWEIASVSGNSVKLVDAPSGTGSGGTIQVVASDVQVSDIDIVDNTFRLGPNALLMIGFHNYSTGTLPTKLTARVRFHNNLVYGMDSQSYADGGWVSANAIDPSGTQARGSYAVSAAYGIEDLTITNNTLIDFDGRTQHLLFHDSTTLNRGSSEGLKVEGNVFLSMDPGSTFPVEIGGGTRGTAALNAQWTRWPNPGWIFRDNVFCCGISGSGYPSGNFWLFQPGDLKLRAYKPYDYSRADFRLGPDSPFLGGKPGKSIRRAGANIQTVQDTRGEVQDVRVRENQAGAAVISYLSPDTNACTVEYSTSELWGTGQRIDDGGGDRVRNVQLSGLSRGATYHYRIYCGTPQDHTYTHPNGSFAVK